MYSTAFDGQQQVFSAPASAGPFIRLRRSPAHHLSPFLLYHRRRPPWPPRQTLHDENNYPSVSITRVTCVESQLGCQLVNLHTDLSKSIQLQLTSSETEVILFGTRCNLAKIPDRSASNVSDFALFLSQSSQIPGLSGHHSRGVSRFCKKSSFYSQLKRVTDRQTDRQTDGKANSTAEHLLHNAR